tara:strand:+ start:464 stop:838 length:375 start_codon:yes stop_codon:yes gene_type:complete
MTAKYCDHLCARKANYYRKSPEERAAYNKRSNTRRMVNDLLPIIRQLLRSAKDVESIEGTPLGRYVAAQFIIARRTDWRLDHALNFNNARAVLNRLAGGEDELLDLEELIFDHIMNAMQPIVKQ